MKILFRTSAFLPIVFIASCAARTESGENSTPQHVPVKLISLDSYNQNENIAVSGQFTTDDETILSFKTNGVINKILVREGDAIKKGQLLATLNLTEINAGLEQAELAKQKAARDYERICHLFDDSVATLEQKQNAKTALDLATQQLRSSFFNRNYSEIRSGGNGYVLRKLAGEGQVIGSGNPVLETNGAQSSGWLLKAAVTDKQWSGIHINDHAKIKLQAQHTESYEGRVIHRSQAVDPRNGLFTVDIQFTGKKPAGIAAGLFGTALIYPADPSRHTGPMQWSIPYDALLDGDGSSGYVFITNDGHTVKKVHVTIAGIEKDKVLISDGLQDAKSLIIAGSAYLSENSIIRIIP